MKKNEHLLGLYLGKLTKKYFGVLTKKLELLDIERYFFVLIIINDNKAKCTQQYIADRLQVDKVAMVKFIEYLSKKGYIVRERNPDDRRELYVSLTAKAKKIMKLIYTAIHKTNKEATTGLTKKQKQDFFSAMEIVSRNLSLAPSRKVMLEVKKTK